MADTNQIERQPENPLLRVIPLGGLQDIGGNATLLETASGSILIDCGLMFPNDDEPGIDYFVPSLKYLEESPIPLLAIFITHGHEDHIGAIPYLLEHFDVPVYGSALALGLLSSRLSSTNWQRHVVRDNDVIEVGAFKVTAIPVTHSVPEAFALKVDTPAGVVIHSGDFKMDPRPRDGRVTDIARLQSFGDDGVLLLLSDSTNAKEPGRSPSEHLAASKLSQVIANATGRVAVTTFASHLHRVAAVIEASLNANRKIVLVGRAMREAVTLGVECGILHYPLETFLTPADFSFISDKMVTILASGSQGEAYSAMTQIAYGEHGSVDLESGDVAIFSARHIPGNEQAISRAVNALVTRGIHVYTDIDGVHASGHGYQEEMKDFIELVRPQYFMPIHGQPIQRVAHQQLALETGIKEEDTFLLNDGDVLEFYNEDNEIIAYRGEPVEVGYLSVDGKVIGDISEVILSDRKILSERGVVFCSLVVTGENSELLGRPMIDSRGLILMRENSELIEDMIQTVEAGWKVLFPSTRQDPEQSFLEVRRAIRSYIKSKLGRRPVIIVNIHRL